MIKRALKPYMAMLASLLLCASCASPPVDSPAAQGDISEFRAFLDTTWQEDLALNPIFASRVGVKDYQDRWNRLDEAFEQETRKRYETRLAALAQFDRASLSAAEQLSYDLYQLNLQRRIASDDLRHHKYVIHQHRGPHTQVPSHLINIHQITNVSDAQAYIARLQNVGDYFAGVIEQLQIRAQKGYLLADWQYPRMIQSARNVISGVPFDSSNADSTLWADFRGKVAALDIDDAQRNRLLDDARTALLDRFAPAYKSLIDALQEQSVNAPDADGVWKFPGGDAFYAERLRWYTTTELTAEEVHAVGLREVTRIHTEMRGIMRELDFAGELSDFFNFMRDDPQFYYPNTEEGREAYLREARAAIKEMNAALPEVFGLLPRADITVKRVEAFRERSAGKAFYQSPPPDGSRPGVYYANLYDMTSMPKYQLAALAYHEGVPGHHMQRAISVELKGIPEFQKYASFTAYTEGWGLYSETLAKEMGFYRDPYSEFGQLATELWRACRLVVDTGIHSKRWTRQEAIDYLLENTPNSTGDVTKSIERYIAQPGQATAYMIGKLKLMELRERAREAMGEAFDLRGFHDTVLEDGPVPLFMLESKINSKINSKIDSKID